ncbi:MAG: ABC transporter ATP-binding protein [Saprospiraceae bacterium]|nr:ABC transporter ATP-binding protein [Saprospiraceae bacterium]MBK8451276.1 ABC transporter ATP-binding protein [Saprospiraceae bacterium]MBK8483238.1 ABC transporter ATP-binding protein [Saprospiraceae bacterium]MBK9220750.1 ABC transporter ATP-binding protein [Saprospiraceae bacterium]MBK9722405.1 ABC transporter ATP-binding protein [Saprospiraceae bacterium]
MIQVKDLSFGYRRKKATLFDALNLELQPGTICGILGKNGAGKTTLLRLVSGLLFPQQGTATVNGFESRERRVDMLTDLFYVQEEYVFPEVTMSKYVEINAVFYPNWDHQKFHQILQDFELPLDKKIKELSFGQKKKFLIAFALATNCKLLILDEPTNGLDIPSKTIFRKVVSASLGDDQCFLISTHQVNDVANLLDRIVVIEGGRVIFNQDLFTISANYRFDFHPGATIPTSYLYSEQVPGGHVVMTQNLPNAQSTDVDIEILFNAIISKSI